MKILFVLFALLVILPSVEIACLLYFGSQIGVLPTLFIILGTGMTGAWLAKREGMEAWRRVRRTLRSGQDPSSEVWNGLCVLVAGIALFIPGFVSDCIGLLLLLPPIRICVIRLLQRHCSFQTIAHNVIDGEDEPQNAPRPGHGDYIDVDSHEVK